MEQHAADHKPVIENLVESIKGYFSITGVIIIGLYLINNASSNPLFKAIDYVSGFAAIVLGSGIGLWYTFHVFHKLFKAKGGTSSGFLQGTVYSIFMLLIFLIICSVVFGSIRNSCDVVFGK